VAAKAGSLVDKWYLAGPESGRQEYRGGLMTGYVCSRCREAFFSAGRGAFLTCPKCGGRPVGFENESLNEAGIEAARKVVDAARKVRQEWPAGFVSLNRAPSDYEKTKGE